MPDDRIARVAAAYDDDAVPYRDHWAPVLRTPGELLLDALPLAGARHVLDLGAGVGVLHAAIGRRAPGASITAVDRSPGMIRLATACRRRTIMDGARLGFASGTFDVAVLSFVLFHFVAPREALGEVRRVLRPGGALGVTTWREPTLLPALDVVRAELDRAGAPEIPGIVAQHELMNTPEKLESLLRDAGLADVRISTHPLDHRNSLETFLARFTLRSLRLRLRALPEASQAAVLERCREGIAALGPEGLLDRTPVIYATARR